MKISKINIKSAFIFNDLEINLTYPKGHEKEGQALDKVCVIGENGVGKTLLLELIGEVSKKIFFNQQKNNMFITNDTIGLKYEIEIKQSNQQTSKYNILNFISLLKFFNVKIIQYKFDNNHILKYYKDFVYVVNGFTQSFQSLPNTLKNIIQNIVIILNDKIHTIDNVEENIHPKIQTKILNQYIEAAKDTQLFVTTNSPIIISCFEPCEIIKLKFDENGKVVVDDKIKKYNPSSLTWNSIFHKFFDVEAEGGENRKQKLQELSNIDVQIKKITNNSLNENLMNSKKELWQKYCDIAEELDWKIQKNT